MLASCGSSALSADVSPVPAGLPPAQALPGSGGTWATLAMGHGGDPLNTFGELFYRSDCSGGSGCGGGAPWVLATPPGVASNGGLMVAANPDGGLTVGFGVSLDLRFSPLAETMDAGSVWSGGILPVALAAVPDALAASGTAHRLALSAPAPVGTGNVLVSGDDLSTWSRLVSRGTVAQAASGSGCALRSLTAVAVTSSPAGADLVAGDCAGGGRAGIFRVGTDGRPLPVTPLGPRVPAAARTELRVLRLVATATGVSALVDASGGGRSRLYLTTTADAASWTVSAPFATGRPVVSTSVTPDGGFVVLFGGDPVPAGAVATPGRGWRSLPSPPPGTAVIASGTADGSLDAFVPSGSELDVDRLGPSGWQRVQVLVVPVQYGSTSAGGGASG